MTIKSNMLGGLLLLSNFLAGSAANSFTCQSLAYRIIDSQGAVTFEDVQPCLAAVDTEAGSSTDFLVGVPPSVVSTSTPRARKGLNSDGKSHFWLYLKYQTNRCRDPEAEGPCDWRVDDDTPVEYNWWVKSLSGSHLLKEGLRPPGILEVFRPRNKEDDFHLSTYDTLVSIGGSQPLGLDESDDLVLYTGRGEEYTTGETDRQPLKTKGSILPPTGSDSPTIEHKTDDEGRIEIRYTTPEAAGTSIISIKLKPRDYDYSIEALVTLDVSVSKSFIAPEGYQSESGAKWVEKPAHQLPARCHGNNVFNGQSEAFDALNRAVQEFGNWMISYHEITSVAHTMITGNPPAALSIPELVVTDISLPWGGLSDLYDTTTGAGCDWSPPHFEHRHGRDIDIRMDANFDSRARNLLEVALRQYGFDFPASNESPEDSTANHWHIHLP